jgi:hypothetical protein
MLVELDRRRLKGGQMSVYEPTVTGQPATPSVGARIYSGLSVLVSVLLVVQIFVAGGGLFTAARQLDSGQSYSAASWSNSGYWGVHFLNAVAILLVVLLLLGVSFLARLPGRTRRFTGILLGLLVLQAVLGFIPWPAPIAALHVLNAFAMLAMALFVTRDNWAFGGSPR